MRKIVLYDKGKGVMMVVLYDKGKGVRKVECYMMCLMVD